MRTSFPLRLSSAQYHPVLALLAAHGISDLDHPLACLPRYVLCAIAPLPPSAVTAAFLVSSLAHFAADVGWRGSVALHAVVGAAGVVGGDRCAARLMATYMLCVHVPLHYVHLARARRFVGATIALLFTVALLLGTRGAERVCLSTDGQRLIVAHVVHNAFGA